jgi:hypothetical protein
VIPPNQLTLAGSGSGSPWPRARANPPPPGTHGKGQTSSSPGHGSPGDTDLQGDKDLHGLALRGARRFALARRGRLSSRALCRHASAARRAHEFSSSPRLGPCHRLVRVPRVGRVVRPTTSWPSLDRTCRGHPLFLQGLVLLLVRDAAARSWHWSSSLSWHAAVPGHIRSGRDPCSRRSRGGRSCPSTRVVSARAGGAPHRRHSQAGTTITAL